MKREIKFRAWDWKEKEFIEAKGDLGFMLSGEVVGWLANKGNYEFQQFTGLHDKNGKEIYEGDICRDEELGMMSEGVFFDSKKAAFYAWWKYENPNKGQRTDTFSGGYFNAEQASKSDVIGNIYENPELLKSDLAA